MMSQKVVYKDTLDAGWNPDNTFAEEIAHLHEEVSEAFREFRFHHDYNIRMRGEKPTGVPVELADVVLGIMFIAERFGFDLEAVIELKHGYNRTRSYIREGRQL